MYTARCRLLLHDLMIVYYSSSSPASSYHVHMSHRQTRLVRALFHVIVATKASDVIKSRSFVAKSLAVLSSSLHITSVLQFYHTMVTVVGQRSDSPAMTSGRSTPQSVSETSGFLLLTIQHAIVKQVNINVGVELSRLAN